MSGYCTTILLTIHFLEPYLYTVNSYGLRVWLKTKGLKIDVLTTSWSSCSAPRRRRVKLAILQFWRSSTVGAFTSDLYFALNHLTDHIFRNKILPSIGMILAARRSNEDAETLKPVFGIRVGDTALSKLDVFKG